MKRLIRVLALAGLAGVALLGPGSPVAAAEPLPGCSYVEAQTTPQSMPLGTVWVGPQMTVPSGACTTLTVHMTYVDGAGAYVRLAYRGAPSTWTYVPAGGDITVATNVPDGLRFRAMFDRQVELFGVYE
jgi:hypothetical protein